jgi:putative DNA primase/helicase
MTASLREIAAELGGEVSGRQVRAPGPGHSRGDRSLSIKLSASSPDGFIAHSFADDSWQDCRDYVKAKLGLAPFEPHAGSIKSAALRPSRPAPAALSGAGEMWRASIDPHGTLVERYLQGRNLELPLSLAGRLVRFHPACPFGPGRRLPCMVTLFRDIATDRPVAIQRTALTPDGAKIGRMTLGPSAGAALKLTPDADVLGGVHVAEGFESALAAMLIAGVGAWLRPSPSPPSSSSTGSRL